MARGSASALSPSIVTSTGAPETTVRSPPGERRGPGDGRCDRGSRAVRAGERALAAHLGRPRVQRRRVGDGDVADLGLRGEDGVEALKGWKDLSWGMVPLLGGAMCACTWHFFYNSESLDVLVALQGALTVIGNITMCIAAYRIFKASKEGSQSS